MAGSPAAARRHEHPKLRRVMHSKKSASKLATALAEAKAQAV